MSKHIDRLETEEILRLCDGYLLIDIMNIVKIPLRKPEEAWQSSIEKYDAETFVKLLFLTDKLLGLIDKKSDLEYIYIMHTIYLAAMRDKFPKEFKELGDPMVRYQNVKSYSKVIPTWTERKNICDDIEHYQKNKLNIEQLHQYIEDKYELDLKQLRSILFTISSDKSAANNLEFEKLYHHMFFYYLQVYNSLCESNQMKKLYLYQFRDIFENLLRIQFIQSSDEKTYKDTLNSIRGLVMMHMPEDFSDSKLIEDDINYKDWMKTNESRIEPWDTQATLREFVEEMRKSYTVENICVENKTLANLIEPFIFTNLKGSDLMLKLFDKMCEDFTKDNIRDEIDNINERLDKLYYEIPEEILNIHDEMFIKMNSILDAVKGKLALLLWYANPDSQKTFKNGIILLHSILTHYEDFVYLSTK